MENLLIRAKRLASRVLVLAFLGATVTVTYVGVSIWRTSDNAVTPRMATTRSDTVGLTPVNPFPGGQYLVAFVVVASDCGWSSQPEVLDAVVHLRESLREAHGNAFEKLSVVAIAIDADPMTGLSFLTDLQGRSKEPVFDQVSAGGSWLNEEIVRLVWRDKVAEPSLPQVIIVQRRVDSEGFLLDGSLEVQQDTLRAQVIGSEIQQWIGDGLPLRDIAADA